MQQQLKAVRGLLAPSSTWQHIHAAWLCMAVHHLPCCWLHQTPSGSLGVASSYNRPRQHHDKALSCTCKSSKDSDFAECNASHKMLLSCMSLNNCVNTCPDITACLKNHDQKLPTCRSVSCTQYHTRMAAQQGMLGTKQHGPIICNVACSPCTGSCNKQTPEHTSPTHLL